MTPEEIVKALRRMAPQFQAPGYEVISDAADLIESLQAELATSQRREQAAVEDLHDHAAFATTCGRYGCGYDCQSPRCPGWQWRGPQDAGKEETE